MDVAVRGRQVSKNVTGEENFFRRGRPWGNWGHPAAGALLEIRALRGAETQVGVGEARAEGRR
jgi:hypothetical protein